MSIPLTGTGSFFVRLGHQIAGMNENNTFAGVTELTRANTIWTDYTPSGPDSPVVDNLYTDYYSWLNTAMGGGNSWLAYMVNTLPQATIVQMAQDSNPLTTTNVTVQGALQILITQMIDVAGGGTLAIPISSIQQNTTSVSVTNHTDPSNPGDGVFAASITAADGGTLQNVFAETLQALVTQDSYTGGAVVGSEGITVFGVIGPTMTL